ncbi:LacI family DNA-binding transcriptional regulator [Echinicola sp. CAU 1574]|uniref:LacI family DNA-binding transcriptional regulator n=1 Tax=Echinicola arenosa TaxID=2774144 RepID=A0ABR9ARQ6_9BACT|nr:LacI family DNA-binding transcriptional regulator [Echinicola arenosa]MBD8490610.1 LacI family DNA-binding transcriptional regulator [Echinicola arenosa]
MSGINIKKLAEALGLAPSTVSRALNDSHEISEKTKKRVLQMADKMNYQPNPFARSLREHRSKTIAMIIPDLVNNFFSQVIEGVEEITQQFGYHLLVYHTHENLEKEKEIVSHLLNGRVDGIMMSVSHQTKEIDHLNRIHQKGIPIIFFDRICESIPTTKFVTNGYQSGFEATSHLVEQGCKRIAFLLLSREISISQQRLKGYVDALDHHGLELDEKLILRCDNQEGEYHDIIKNFLNQSNKPDAVLAAVEKLAISTYYVAKELEISIPDDLKVVSFSNMKIADLLNPSLTTIAQPTHEFGRQAASLLMKKLNKKNTPDFADEVIVLPSTLHIRASSTRK